MQTTDGDNLRFWLARLKLKQKDFADKIGKSTTTVRNLLATDRFNPKQIDFVIDGLGISEDEFFGQYEAGERLTPLDIDFVEQLRKLSNLHKEGAITSEEYEISKKYVIESATGVEISQD